MKNKTQLHCEFNACILQYSIHIDFNGKKLISILLEIWRNKEGVTDMIPAPSNINSSL